MAKKLFSNAPKWVPPPPKPSVFKTTLEKQKYWAKEKERWREGYGDGYSHLCGMHYYYLTQGNLKDGSDGSIIRPKYRDGDEWIINPLHDAFWTLKNHVGLVKRREIGATSIGAGLLPSYTMRMFPSSTFGMTSCDQPRIFKAFSDKTSEFIKRMDLDIRPVLDRTVGYKENATKQQVFLRLPWLVKNAQGASDYEFSELYAKETSESDEAAKGFSGTRMRAAYYDEFPLHKRKSKLLTSSTPCFMKQADQSGLLFWAGTVESDITNEQIVALQNLVMESDILRFNVLFAPAWWCLFMDENGVSDEQKGVEWVLSERERLEKSGDKTYVNAFIKNYPLTLQEIFDLGGSGMFTEDNIRRIKLTIASIDENPPPINPHELTNMGGKIEVVPVKKSPIEILEHPKPGIEYRIGIDGTGTTKESGVLTGSDVALVVVKMYDPSDIDSSYTPVAFYTERPKSFPDSYGKMTNIIRHYNTYGLCKVQAESNQGNEHFGGHLIREGLERVIMMRQDLSGKGHANTSKMFTFRTKDVINWQYRQANIIIEKYGHNFKIKKLLLEMLLSYDTNTDILDAWLMCLCAMGMDFDVPVVKKKRKPAPKMYFDEATRTYKWEEPEELDEQK